MLDAARLVESLGHSHCITKTAEHADINDQGPDGHTWANALIPMHPKTLRILGDLRIDLY